MTHQANATWKLCWFQLAGSFVSFFPTCIDIGFSRFVLRVKLEILSGHSLKDSERPNGSTGTPQNSSLWRYAPEVAHPELHFEHLSWDAAATGILKHCVTIVVCSCKTLVSLSYLQTSSLQDTQEPLKSQMKPYHRRTRVFDNHRAPHSHAK